MLIRKIVILIIFVSSYLICQSSNFDFCNSGDKYFYNLDYDKALETYKRGLVHSPNDYELNWKIARVLVNYGEVPGNEKKKLFLRSKKIC